MHVLVRSYPSGTAPLRLDPDCVAVWTARLDDLPVPAEQLGQHLTAEELVRGERFRSPHIRDQFVRARGLLRLLLGRYLQCAPQDVPIGVAADGKPLLVGVALEFNVSHTGGAAVIAVSSRPVGIDIETVREVSNQDALVRRFFAPSEREQFGRLPTELRAAAFFRGWTCKEAVLKGIGCGTRDLDRCVVDLDPRRPSRVVGPPETVSSWSVASWTPEGDYAAAVAVEFGTLELTVEVG